MAMDAKTTEDQASSDEERSGEGATPGAVQAGEALAASEGDTAPRANGEEADVDEAEVNEAGADVEEAKMEEAEVIEPEADGTKANLPEKNGPVVDDAEVEGPEAAAAPSATSKRRKPKTGVVYLSRVPPGMEVGTIRSLLGRVGGIGRVYLRRESAESRRTRAELGSRRTRAEWRDGWVEFTRRSAARRAVGLLNGRAMAGAKRRGRWADDLWCMRLLKGFEWADLVAETGTGGRERVLKVRAEVAAARRERAFVEESVAKGRRMERRAEAGEGGRRGGRVFGQKRVIEREEEEDVDERRARKAMERADRGETGAVDGELAGLLFKKRRTG